LTEQTSLACSGAVDIYVEDKITLTKAVIASDTGDLMLDTGSFEYSNIKGNDRSYNVGGGINFGGNSSKAGDDPVKNKVTYNIIGNYGFSDSRQTNFATIGEGTITVRDGEADLSKLNRDTTISQYNTKDGGLQGGFSVDTATVNLIAHPENTVVNTAKAVEKGSLIAYSIGEGAVKAVDVGVDKGLGIEGTLEAVVNARKDVLTVVAIAENRALREGIDKALET
jgi:hypothetical protein